MSGRSYQGAKPARAVDEGVTERFFKKGLPRSFDIVSSLFGLVVTLPLLVASAAVVALTSSGGALFRQKRVGLNGRTFTLYKLRTMRAASDGREVISGNNARVTRAGRVLRKSKLDELPTLWNVLRGDMSLVGPRPEVPRYVNLEDPTWQAVLAARPGITDPVTLSLRNEEEMLAQVNGDAEQFYLHDLQPLKLKGYLAYLHERNWRTDFRVLCRTIAAVVTR